MDRNLKTKVKKFRPKQQLEALFDWLVFLPEELCRPEWPKTNKKSVYLCFPSGGIKGMWHGIRRLRNYIRS